MNKWHLNKDLNMFRVFEMTKKKWTIRRKIVIFPQDFCHVEVKALLLALSHILLGNSASPLFFIYFFLKPWSSSWPKISKVAQRVSLVN